MFRGPVPDRPHLQDWPDVGMSMATRLADLLTRSGSMQWSATVGTYHCDLGLGGAKIPVGSAVQIWNNSAIVTVATLKKSSADAAAAKRHPLATSAAALAPVTQADVTAMQRQLRQQLELADTNWQAWKPH